MTNEEKKILYLLRSHADDRGFHYWADYLFCPRAARLKAENRQAFADERFQISGNMGMGTVFHAMMEMWRDPQNPRISNPSDCRLVSFANADVDHDSRADGERLAVEYMTRFGREELGTVRHVEHRLLNDELGSLFGLPAWSGTIDLVTDISAKTARDIGARHPVLADIRPGIWLHDYKSGGQNHGSLADSQLNSFQFAGYMLAWDLIHPHDCCRGLIVHNAIKTKIPNLFFRLVPKPGRAQVAALMEFYRLCRFFKEEMPDVPLGLEKNCFSIFGICSHWSSGACDRGPSRLKVIP